MRPFFIGLSISLGFTINPMLMAQNAGPEIQDLIHNFNFLKEDIEGLIAKLAERGEISMDQADEALYKLDGLTEDEIHHMTMDALQNVADEDLVFAEREHNTKGEFLTGLDFDFSSEESFPQILTKKSNKKIQ